MKLTFKEKAKLFWDRNKKDILGWLIGAGVITGVGCGIAYAADKANKKREANMAEWRREIEEERKKALEEEKAKEEKIKNNPANQIAGGYVDPSNDNLADAEYPNILVNSVPVTNIGELGQEVIQRLNEEWFGEFGETGAENPFDPATATADVYIDFGHEVWKRNHPEEAAEESQEKQSA